MGGRVETRFILVCDVCGIELGTEGEYSTAVEARAAAFGLGWKFPAKKRRNGTPMTGNTPSTSMDVCGGCAEA